MRGWVNKCNSRELPYQKAYGDWEEFFTSNVTRRWGSTEWRPGISVLKPGDIIIVYQTNRNEIVGLAKVVRFDKPGSEGYCYLRPLRRISVKVRPLKVSHAEIAAIPAFKAGPIKTVYDITLQDAERLLQAAGLSKSETNKLLKSREIPLWREQEFSEGEKRAAAAIVRSAKLRLSAKEKWGTSCYYCGFDSEAFYGTRAQGACIVHHLKGFADHGKRRSTVSDVRVVCANCHYVLHIDKQPCNIDKLRRDISRRWFPWSDKGVTNRN